MRRLFVVTYDISDPKRLRKVFRILKGFGEHLQLSVFRCDLTESQRIRLEARLADVIHHEEDQVMFVELGPSEGRQHRIAFLGRPGKQADPRQARVF